MPQLTKEQRVFIVEKYFELKSINAVKLAFQERFDREAPCKSAIQKNVKTTSRHYSKCFSKNATSCAVLY